MSNRITWPSVACLALLFLAPSPLRPQDAGSDWPAPYTNIHRYGYSLPESARAEMVAAFPFERIEMSAPGGLLLPAYTVTFWRDGKAHYKGNSHADRTGEFEGTIDAFTFGRLCFLFECERFLELKSTYGGSADDMPSCSLSVWRSGKAEPITVTDNDLQGPIQLWGLQAAVDAVASHIEWKAVSKPK